MNARIIIIQWDRDPETGLYRKEREFDSERYARRFFHLMAFHGAEPVVSILHRSGKQ